MASASTTSDRIVLLFCHGGSYTHDCWRPIERRLRESALFKRVPFETAAFTWRYHGAKRDHSIRPTITYRDGNQKAPRAEHPVMKWPVWAAPDLEKEIELLRKDDTKLNRRTRIIGVGHSMGATVLLQVETSKPGTLDGIIAFEPVYNDGSITKEANQGIQDMLTGICLKGVSEWNTYEDMMKHLTTSRAFRRWDAEVLEAFMEQGVEKTEDGKRYRLAMPADVEASLYCHELVNLSVEDLAKTQCKIVIESSAATVFFSIERGQKLAQALPGKFVIADSIPNTTHGMVVEDPAACAAHILDGLIEFPVFQAALVTAKL